MGMEGNSNSDEEQVTMKPVYEFTWSDGSTRRTDELENDGPHFREEGVECLAAMGREDPDCEVKMVGLQQIGA
ncbi:hypothetical protein M199_gp099 [Halogranum tailed virus 1]|uniref:Uncharacterized protein n=1 Tax=Halogranum tailed virus 1 TaxID=1273749 RepID=R4TLJ1_9CAUD|nr:hypothetical protein M199_gp099 [Halogranum tailed virus 1]AGM11567.1 hypothetical protein HGTV1_270 [Halogranum tailed virus 1]